MSLEELEKKCTESGDCHWYEHAKKIQECIENSEYMYLMCIMLLYLCYQSFNPLIRFRHLLIWYVIIWHTYVLAHITQCNHIVVFFNYYHLYNYTSSVHTEKSNQLHLHKSNNYFFHSSTFYWEMCRRQ